MIEFLKLTPEQAETCWVMSDPFFLQMEKGDSLVKVLPNQVGQTQCGRFKLRTPFTFQFPVLPRIPRNRRFWLHSEQIPSRIQKSDGG
jgi:hypothetical protein